MTTIVHKPDSLERTKHLRDESEVSKAENGRLSFELSSKQKTNARHVEDIEAFTERLGKSGRAASKEKSKCIIAEKQMTEDVVTIESLSA